MSEPYEWTAEETFDYVTDWQEAVGDTQPGGGGSFSSASQEATLVGYVDGRKYRSALAYFLGRSYCDADSPYLLYREPPARHPEHPQLYCYTASFVGVGPRTTAGAPLYSTSPFTGYYGEELYYQQYEKVLLTLRYKSFGRTLFLPNDELADADVLYEHEWKRFTDITIGPAIQALTADGSSQLRFAEGGVPPAGPEGTAFPAPIAELMAKSNLSIRWQAVPHEYLSDSRYYLKPTKIVERLGTINNASFVGLAAGTCLLTAAQFDPVLYPVTPADPYRPLTGWDVTLSFEHFDPEKGVPASEYRGHRLFPWRVDGEWYYATRENASRELLPLTDMLKVFQHVSDPS